MGATVRMMERITTASSGRATRNTWLRRVEMPIASTRALTSITGARTSMRMLSISVICMVLQSVVRRVMREAVENFSMFRKAYS